MRLTRVLWYTCTMLAVLGMLIASASTAVPQYGSTSRERGRQAYLAETRGDPGVVTLGALLRH